MLAVGEGGHIAEEVIGSNDSYCQYLWWSAGTGACGRLG